MLITYTGKTIDYDNINPDNLEIEDILNSLSRVNRFNGHSKRAYSVLEHSIICYNFAKMLNYSKREQLLCLIHDFSEAYVGDCPSPLKALMPEYVEIEKRVEKALLKKMKVEEPTKEEKSKVKMIDLTALYCEMRDLTHHNITSIKTEDISMDLAKNFIIYPKSKVSEDELVKRASAILTHALEDARLEELFSEE